MPGGMKASFVSERLACRARGAVQSQLYPTTSIGGDSLRGECFNSVHNKKPE